MLAIFSPVEASVFVYKKSAAIRRNTQTKTVFLHARDLWNRSGTHKLNKSIFVWTGVPLGAPSPPRRWTLPRSVLPRRVRNRLMPESM